MTIRQVALRLLRHAGVAVLASAAACGGGLDQSPTEPAPTGVAIEARADARLDGAPAAAVTFKISGAIVDKNYPSFTISGAKVAIAGVSTATANAKGVYALKVAKGNRVFRITASGYGTISKTVNVKGTSTQNFSLIAAVPKNSTARCKDRTWSQSKHRSGTCSHHKGVAYWVCPGLLCKP
jgi:hypothetical protein